VITTTSRPIRIAVVGGGIAGLAAAHRLQELDPAVDVHLFEASSRLGGVLRTSRQDGFLLEEAADNFITTAPGAANLCRRLGMADQLLPTNPDHRGAQVVRRGRLHPIPPGFMLMASARLGPLLKTPLLSPAGKLRMALDPLVPRRRDGRDESIAAFVTRRLGREVYERLVQPLVGSIYGSDPGGISLPATMPHFAAMEREHGSLYRAMRKKARERERSAGHGGARYSMFVAPRDGMSSLVEALAERLPAGNVHLASPIVGLGEIGNGRWRLSVGGSWPGEWDADGVILASPAGAAARLLQNVDRPLAAQVDQIRYSGSILVTLGYDRRSLRRPLDSFGFVVPQAERRPVLSASFVSVKYPGRAPRDRQLIRVFMGGRDLPELLEMLDEELIATAHGQLRELAGVAGRPCLTHVVRHRRGMPRYTLGHLERVTRIQRYAEQHVGLALAGAAYHGVGAPHCIHSGEQTAERVLGMIRSSRPPRPAARAPRLAEAAI